MQRPFFQTPGYRGSELDVPSWGTQVTQSPTHGAAVSTTSQVPGTGTVLPSSSCQRTSCLTPVVIPVLPEGQFQVACWREEARPAPGCGQGLVRGGQCHLITFEEPVTVLSSSEPLVARTFSAGRTGNEDSASLSCLSLGQLGSAGLGRSHL